MSYPILDTPMCPPWALVRFPKPFDLSESHLAVLRGESGSFLSRYVLAHSGMFAIVFTFGATLGVSVCPKFNVFAALPRAFAPHPKFGDVLF